MNNLEHISTFIVFIIFIYTITYVGPFSEVNYVKSKNKENFIVRNLPDKQKAADLLDDISNDLKTIVQHLNNNKSSFKEHSSCIELINKRFNAANLSEGNLDFKYTTYTINKGEKMVFCLRQRNSEELHRRNLILFVAIHELAHIASHSIDHTDEFHKNNKFLLQEAIKIGVYKPEKFNTRPVNYCGTDITHEPI